jgi:hypothetical protein
MLQLQYIDTFDNIMHLKNTFDDKILSSRQKYSINCHQRQFYGMFLHQGNLVRYTFSFQHFAVWFEQWNRSPQ